MCDVCADFLDLLQIYDGRITNKESDERPSFEKEEVDTVFQYIQAWPQRQCTCCFRDGKNFDRFNWLTQGVVLLSVAQLKEMSVSADPAVSGRSGWTLADRERLMHLLSKVFLLNFPLYAAFKQSSAGKLEEVSAAEAAALNVFCDLHDPEIPSFLLRNVCLFCKAGGPAAMTACFENSSLPVPLAHALVAVVCNLKLWLNYRSVVQLFVPLRSRVLRYMCGLPDKDLRVPGIKTMADFMWSAVKDPLDSPLAFDRDGLDLAFKYFTSSTLTMRLAGIAQINSHINMFNELCNNESIMEVENVGQNLANWLIENQIISHIFGPNLHVEVIKQSHIILSFLAMECKITDEHIDIIWQAAQLKHCSKQVHDLLPPLIKNLESGPVLHLYNLLCKMEPKDHTEQSLYLASALIKFIWTSAGTYSQVTTEAPFLSMGNKSVLKPGVNGARTNRTGDVSSSENSISMENSNSEDEQGCCMPSDTAQLITKEKDQGDKTVNNSKHKKSPINVENSDGSLKVEELEEDEDVKNNVERGTSPVKTPKISCPQQVSGDGIPSSGQEEDSEVEQSKSANSKRRRKLMKRHCRHRAAPQPKGQGNEVKCTELTDDDEEEEEDDEDEEDDEPKASVTESIVKDKDPVEQLTEPDQEVPNVLMRDCGPDLVEIIEDHSHDSSHDSTQGAVMTELASLVQGSQIHDCRPYMRNYQAHRELMDEMMSGEEGSYSSRMSNKSEKNMADFEGEESPCEDELVQLAAQAQAHTLPVQHMAFHSRFHTPKMMRAEGTHIKMDAVCKPGNTLLWDLIQDDKIGQLGEGLAVEAEKALSNLLCFNTERVIRMKFIEGCLENLAKNWSVVVSLRLLPKLFGSFQQFRGMDTHQVTTWAEREHNMMECFFNNLKVYTKEGPKNSLYSHQTEIQVRLQFLTTIYAPICSPENFRLSIDQLDILWNCLATDAQCADELFSWLLNQAKSRDQHALGSDALRHLYLHKLPALAPERISMTGLALFQQLCSLARDADMSHLWKVALRVSNTDVSMAAIQYLNSYYVGRQLDHESEFVSQCMAHLGVATADLEVAEESSLLCIQRALLLLKTHLETFRRRYAYHLRRWMLEGHGVGSHVLAGDRDRGSMPVRVVVQPAGMTDKTTLELLSTDYVADLRAEVAHWWNPRAADGPIRIITQGQELTTELDEKTLQEMGFKDLQLVFVSVGASRQQKKRDTAGDIPSVLPPPPRESLPTLLLLQQPYFEQLFSLMQTLSSMKTPVKGGHHIPHTKAQVLSRRVWDILTLLPTNPVLLQGFQKLGESDERVSLQSLLDPASPQKLMYSLYIVESLSRPHQQVQNAKRNGGNSVQHQQNQEQTQFNKATNANTGSATSAVASENEKEAGVTWSQMFIQHGGLRHLFDIFMSGVLQQEGSEWQQDCLACLLKLLCHLGVQTDDSDFLHDIGSIRNKRARRFHKLNSDKSSLPKLNDDMLQMMDIDTVIPRLTSILYEASLPRDPNHYKTGFWGRAQVVHYAMALLVAWAHTTVGVRQAVMAASDFSQWLQRLVLEDPEPAVRREACTALYRLCLGDAAFTAQMLSHLMEQLPVAESMRPQRLETIQHVTEEGKEPYGPACRDYFWLLCRLVDSLSDDIIKESIEDPQSCVIDIDGLAKRLSQSILTREYLETRHNTVEDDGLIGLLNLMSNVLKHNPPFKNSKEGKDFLIEVFDLLFALPNPRKRYVPKCKSQLSRSSAYDLLVELAKESPGNYRILHEKLLEQHRPGPHSPYPWDYWPHEDGRSDCGFVGLTNLGATCYMASCMQHLYMMPQARSSILQAQCDGSSKHEMTLRELQRMFAYLLESERKAYNPRSFCKVYTMDHQPLNTGEQKDMAEFFIDLVSKLEEMTPELKKLVKTLFGGVISNNVVSLDCEHVSRKLEEFYTVRCQVADMRNLYESLDEVTVKDTLEGDNMYTCSQCGKKVRAEKRACFKKLPHILCFNTMRYTFNMSTMLKEKVNTHFSFPLRLDMSGYVEKHLMPQHYQEEKRKSELRKSEKTDDQEEEDKEASYSEDFNECYEYDLIGVTVHTGTADGGHYYSFIRDRTASNRDKWFLFNDAEVKPFDPNQIAAECFGGEMTSKTYDSVTDKFMDFSFEKTNSAYMLFYEWVSRDGEQRGSKEEPEADALTVPQAATAASPPAASKAQQQPTFELSKELEDWIWQDNMHFLQDKNIFEHTYFNFMWQVCGYIPQTLISLQSDITEMAAQLSTSFFVETFIHAKEKPTMVQWVELLTKQFNASQAACEWFLGHMAENDWWPVQILIKCPNQIVRQMFQRLCIHVIQRLRPNHAPLYLKSDGDTEEEPDPNKIGNHSCVTRFVRMLLSLMEHGAKAHLKNLTEYFSFFNEFIKMGEEESQFLLSVQAITMMVSFYLGQKSQQEYVEVVSEEEDEEEVIPLPTDKYKPASLEKMISLVAILAEKSRGSDHLLKLSTSDLNAIAGGKGFPFLYQQIKDAINLHQTRNLIYALCRWNERLAVHIVAMIFQAITKHSELCQPFFKILTLLIETTSGMTGLPPFTQLILQHIWEVAEFCAQSALDWLAVQAPRNKTVHTWVLQSMDTWVEHFLLGHNNQRVRSAAAYLLVSLVPNPHFRQGYRTRSPYKDVPVCPEAQVVIHQIYNLLLRLLKPARHYTDIQTHGAMKLTAYFAVLTYCCTSRTEKLMFGQHFLDLWQLFHPKLSEPSIPVHHNKQALLLFWHHVCVDCPENVQLILQNAHVTKNIAFNYILADHEDQDVVMFNRTMLPAYYGLLRMCCQQSRTFTRSLANHQNLHWAFKNITPHPTQYSAAVDELFKLIQLFVMKFPDSTEQELHEISAFRRQTLQLYLQVLDGRSCWTTLIMAFRTLIDSDDDRLYVIYNGGLQLAFEALQTLHTMYHEATACHVLSDLLELLSLLCDFLKCVRMCREPRDIRTLMLQVKEWVEVLRKISTLLNTYNPPEMRSLCIELLKEMVLLMPQEVIQVLVPLLSHCHAVFQENHNALPMGPYFPRRGHKLPPHGIKSGARPTRPMVQMAIPHGQLEAAKGVDEEYDHALHDFYSPYHEFIDVMCRLAINNECMSEALVNLSAMVGFEGVPLHLTFFPKLWVDIYHAQHVDRKYIGMLTNSNYFVDYVEAVLLDERSSLNIGIVYNFLCLYFPKVASHVLTEQTCNLIDNLVTSLSEIVPMVNVRATALKLNGDLRALTMVYNSDASLPVSDELTPTLLQLLTKAREARQTIEAEENADDVPCKKRKLSAEKKEEEAEPKPSGSKDEDEPVASSPSPSPSSDKTESSSPCSSKSQHFSVSCIELLEKTIIDLKTCVEKKS
ncbi:ubiquitin carboxyl-terminal hydrolase 34 [Schistocerca serialis cubense]|uniref:ubiquitin carboxyl-terminal hydrolase 34 n=1 Tax=Schistocerca serialis cubense TaxID=2023355 RepID=UPI00214F36C6|nr:ubiquitin carboxyl-terminal hydrolase 34 [Schistocerca serialis cubense]